MPLSEEEAHVYQKTLQTAERQLEEIDRQIEKELAEVRERLAGLQERRKAASQIYDAACAMLGIQNVRGNEEEEGSDTKEQI